jgi:hypothetical protein
MGKSVKGLRISFVNIHPLLRHPFETVRNLCPGVSFFFELDRMLLFRAECLRSASTSFSSETGQLHLHRERFVIVLSLGFEVLFVILSAQTA